MDLDIPILLDFARVERAVRLIFQQPNGNAWIPRPNAGDAYPRQLDVVLIAGDADGIDLHAAFLSALGRKIGNVFSFVPAGTCRSVPPVAPPMNRWAILFR